MNADEWSAWTTRASAELADALRSVAPDAIERILCSGAGREGLMVRALCMRLMHLGCDAHMVGDMTTPPVGAGDLLIVSAGPGHSAVQEALMARAWNAGARTLVVTAQAEGPTPRAADVVMLLPAQTMADDTGAPASMLPMGTLFEWLELAFFDLLAIHLRERSGQTLDQIRERHTNVE